MGGKKTRRSYWFIIRIEGYNIVLKVILILNRDRIAISITESGSPNDNALAERVNGIVKIEFFPKKINRDHKEAKKSIEIIKTITIKSSR